MELLIGYGTEMSNEELAKQVYKKISCANGYCQSNGCVYGDTHSRERQVEGCFVLEDENKTGIIVGEFYGELSRKFFGGFRLIDINMEVGKSKYDFSNLNLSEDIANLTGNRDKGMFHDINCLLYTSPSPRDRTRSRMPSSA